MNKKLSNAEIEKMIQDSIKFADEDDKKKEYVDIKNEATSFIYTTQKLINDVTGRIPQEKVIIICDALIELKEALDQNPDTIKTKLGFLKNNLTALANSLEEISK